MHATAMEHGKLFFDSYLNEKTGLKIVDIGAQDVNGSLRSVAPKNNEYIGVDFCEGNGVDIVLDDPYTLPFESETIDVVVSSSCYEHSEFFWLSFNEALRVLKPSGLLYVNVPSDGPFHRYPVDCYRFYPDSGVALQNWGRRSGYECTMLESFIGAKLQGLWHDFVAVWLKDESNRHAHPNRMISNNKNFTNGRLLGSEEILNFAQFSEETHRNITLSPEQLLNLVQNVKDTHPDLASRIKLLLN